MAPDQRSGRRHDQWAQLRFAVIGTLLAAPPKKGELHAALTALAARTWQHPIRGVPMRVARSTLERWYYHARHAPVDPVRALRRRLRRDAGQQPAIGEPLRHVLRAQYDAHRSWSYQLHVDNLRVLVEADAALGPLARDRRGRDRGRAAGRALCRRAGRLELYVRRGHRDATECRFHPESQPGDGGLSRRALFERFDRPALRPLPAERFVYTEWRQVRVNIDYHVDVERHFYSVPYRLVHQTLDVRVSATTVEVFQRGTRLWVHRRRHQVGGFTTIPEHMPHAHRAHLEWSPSRLIRWGATVGPHTAALVEQILASRPHPEQGYRSCLGLLRLAKQYSPARVEAASARAGAMGARSYRHVEAMLKHGLDRVPLDPDEAPSAPRPGHANVRGPVYYQQEIPHAD